jgi:hypothetical protein
MIRRATISSVAAFLLGTAIVLAACGGTERSAEKAIPYEVTGQTAGLGVDMGEEGSMAPDSSENATSGSSAGAAALALDRKVIQNTSLDLQVEDVSKSYQSVMNITLASGGFVIDSSTSASQDRPQADLTIRVPAAAYESVLEQLRGLAIKVEKETSNSQDVTDQYIDLEARLRNQQALEVQYLDFLGRAQNITEMLQIQDRLSQVRLEIERIQGQANAIDTLSSLATISVHLSTEPVVEQPEETHLDPLAAAGHGWEASLTFLRAMAAAVLATAAFLWWFVPVLVVAGFVSLFFVRRGRGRASP